jgi:hypothetical protein
MVDRTLGLRETCPSDLHSQLCMWRKRRPTRAQWDGLSVTSMLVCGGFHNSSWAPPFSSLGCNGGHTFP